MDSSSGRFARAEVEVVYRRSPWHGRVARAHRAPFVLPELKYLEAVTLADERCVAQAGLPRRAARPIFLVHQRCIYLKKKKR